MDFDEEIVYVVVVPGFTPEERHEFSDQEHAVNWARSNTGSHIEVQKRLVGW